MDLAVSEVLEVMAMLIAAAAFFVQWQAFSNLREEVHMLRESLDRRPSP